MNNFEAKSLKQASKYLQDKLDRFSNKTDDKQEKEKENVYVVGDKKDFFLKRLVGSIFK